MSLAMNILKDSPELLPASAALEVVEAGYWEQYATIQSFNEYVQDLEYNLAQAERNSELSAEMREKMENKLIQARDYIKNVEDGFASFAGYWMEQTSTYSVFLRLVGDGLANQLTALINDRRFGEAANMLASAGRFSSRLAGLLIDHAQSLVEDEAPF